MQTIDKIAVGAIAFLSLTIGVLVWGTNACGTECLFHVKPQVTDFSWQNKAIGREDRGFLLNFNRPIDRDSVEQNLTIEPPLEGKISWSGNKLAYTLNSPAPYGEEYRLSLQDGKQKFVGGEETGEAIEPFKGEFSTRDRAFAYIASEGNNQGRLILYNWTKPQKTVLTPKDLVVFDFQAYPQGDRILFSATNSDRDISQLKLYTVTTGINKSDPESFTPKVKLVLDSKQYQNNKFELSQDGKTIIVQRINRSNPLDFGLWQIISDRSPQPLKTESVVGDFLITPDSQALAVAQGEGIALLPLDTDSQPLDFLPQFGRIVSFSADGMAAAMVDYNQENADLRYTKSLYYVNNQGIQKELLNLEGSIIDCQFNPTATDLYCLLTELKSVDNLPQGQASTEEYREQPYIAAINIKTATITPLLALPEYQDSQLSVAPDGLGVLFDQVLTTNVANSSKTTIIKSRLWLLIPPSNESEVHQVEQLPLIGFHPQWLP